jgi:Lipase (class 3)
VTSDAELAALVAAAYSQKMDVVAGDDARCKFVDRGREFIIVCPGTVSLDGWIRDLEAWPSWDHALGPCHDGFLANGRALWRAVLPHIPLGKRTCYAGHSLGGAEAQILAALHLKHNLGPCRVVTFGSPRVGLFCNPLFPLLIYKAAQLTLYSRPDDPVPDVPFAPLYVHARAPTIIGTALPGSDPRFTLDPVNDPNHGIARYASDLAALAGTPR